MRGKNIASVKPDPMNTREGICIQASMGEGTRGSLTQSKVTRGWPQGLAPGTPQPDRDLKRTTDRRSAFLPCSQGDNPQAPRFSEWLITPCCCCSVALSCPTLCDPLDHSTPGLSVPHHLRKFVQVHVHCTGDAIQPSHPLTPSSPPLLLHYVWLDLNLWRRSQV